MKICIFLLIFISCLNFLQGSIVPEQKARFKRIFDLLPSTTGGIEDLMAGKVCGILLFDDV